MRRRAADVTTLGLVIVLFLAVSGCKQTSSQPGGAEDRPFTESTQSLPPLDPIWSVDLPGGRILAKIHRGLYAIGQDGPVTELVRDERVSSAGRTLDLSLHQGVRFSDGTAVDARAVKTSLDRLAGLAGSGAGPRQSEFRAIASVEVVSAYAVRLHLQRPDPALRQKLTLPSAFIYAKRDPSIVGCGPYVLSGEPDAHALTLSPNPYYVRLPNDAAPGPLKSGIRFLFQPEESANRFLFLKNDLDLFRAPPLSVRALAERQVRLLSRPEGSVVYIAFNTTRADLDKAMRRAANMLVNRRALIDHVVRGQGLISTGPVPPIYRAGLPIRGRDTDTFDPDAARKLLSMSRYSRAARPLVFLHKSDTDSAWIARAVTAMLEEGGIPVERRPMDRNLLRQMNQAKDGDLFLFNWTADFPNAEDFLLPLFHSRRPGNAGNRSHFNNAAVDQLLDAIAAGGARGPLIRDAVSLIEDESPWIFLYFPIETAALSNRVRYYGWPASYSSDRGLGIRMDTHQ